MLTPPDPAPPDPAPSDPAPSDPAVAEVHRWVEMYRWMAMSRAIEDRLARLHLEGAMRGRLISGRGQEAIPVGAAMALARGDVAAPVHRDLGVHLVRGTSPTTILRHYLGRATGPSRGRDGDIHMGEWQHGVFPMVSHLPDSWPVACGVALGMRLGGEPNVVMAFCGDGATSTGTWHESMNFAAVFDLPMVLVVENNQYAYSTPTSRQYRVARLADRSAAYGMEGLQIDGNDVVAVYRAARDAVARARAGAGPTMIEALTMRIDGHAVHDAAEYVPAELLATWKARDPIAGLRARLVSMGVAPGDLAAIDAALADEVAAAARTARADPEPTPGDDGPSVYAMG